MIVFLLCGGIVGFQGGESTQQQLNFLRVGYRANKDSFEHGSFEFDYTRGFAANLEDAEAGVFSRAITEHGLYVFDGKNGRFELIANPNDIIAATTVTGKTRSSFAWACRTLTDGKTTLVDNFFVDLKSKKFIHRPEIYEGTRSFYDERHFQFPLWIPGGGDRRYDLFHDVTEVLEGRSSLVELDFNAELNGRKVCKFACTYEDGKGTYWIDPDRGCVPMRIVDRSDDGKWSSILIFDGIEHLPEAGWLPSHRTHILTNGMLVDRLVITSADTRKKPDLSMFRLEFPEPVRLVNRPDGLLYERGNTWSLLKLPTPSAPGVQVIRKAVAGPLAEMPGELEGGETWRVVGSAILLLFLIIGAALVFRKLGWRLGRTNRG